ncbi:gns1 sur4 family protein [Diaporthe amygdali]|uniref:gns1 sur4 family protein n=1 Tax=Phomopsis amygdali TaxID=1214568 RepID=UPI0022FEEA01|nr:gns1 sur4 family protein [Diaporthe amygdali]KAJ0118325.1 gns1 sur4 family protein [Diaporthe amygdali]
MDSSQVFATTPDPDLFKSMLSPASLREPQFLPPPAPGSIASAPPVLIPDHIYQAALDPKVPLTIAALYAVTAKLLNWYNTSNSKRPWAISRTRLFHVFIVVHNIFLAVYSAWTFYGMVGVMRRSVVNPWGPAGLNGFVDSMTRLHGPAGLGNAVYYSQQDGRWAAYSDNVALASDGTPSRTDLGRIWNEGLAFYGWIFYLSKFYEVLDTLIILAKGKQSSVLQTYHHAGAMMCMWAGMRYMSPPIWMFVFVNSGIHAMMYTYYTLSAFSIRVPVFIKRTLTSLQITQFLVGASYAMIHSFVSYSIPMATTVVQGAAAPAASSVDADTEPASGPAFLDSLKQIVLGVASKVTTSVAEQAASAEANAEPEQSTTTQETVYTQEVVPCINTTGQTFAIWLNVLYLAPLTYLFVKFFITSYLRRSSAGSAQGKGKGSRESQVAVAEKAGWDAAQSIQQEVYGEGSSSGQSNGAAAANGQTNGKASSGIPKPAARQRRHA